MLELQIQMDNVITVQLHDITPHYYALHRIRSHRLWNFPRHRHTGVLEFYYLFEGEVTHHFDDCDFTMKEGDFMMIQEDEYHSMSGRNFDFFNLILPLNYWKILEDTLGLKKLFQPGTHEQRFVTHFQRSQQGRFLDDLERLFLYQKTGYGDILLTRFLFTLASEIKGPPKIGHKREIRSETPPWMKTLFMEVDGRMGEPLSVKDLSELSSRSPEHLSRSFRKHLGMTPSTWLNRQKLDRAALMLEHSNTAVLDIALSLGFDNLGYFYRLFKDRFGIPPAEYRKKRSLVYYGD